MILDEGPEIKQKNMGIGAMVQTRNDACPYVKRHTIILSLPVCILIYVYVSTTWIYIYIYVYIYIYYTYNLWHYVKLHCTFTLSYWYLLMVLSDIPMWLRSSLASCEALSHFIKVVHTRFEADWWFGTWLLLVVCGFICSPITRITRSGWWWLEHDFYWLLFYFPIYVGYSTLLLVGGDWNMTGLFFHIFGIIIPIDSYFSEG